MRSKGKKIRSSQEQLKRATKYIFEILADNTVSFFAAIRELFKGSKVHV